MNDMIAIRERLLRPDREEPLAGPRSGLDPWIISHGWVDNWVLDMCDHREPRDWERDAPAARPLAARVGASIRRAAGAFRVQGRRTQREA